ncbi:MAG: hypothetical protein AAFY84_16130 [Pseudomonadota bacterium]
MTQIDEITRHQLTSAKSKAFPTDAEVAEWNALSDAEKMAIVEADEEAGFQSGFAPHETAAERIAKARASRVS